jgi:hypothetical protein
MREISGDHSGGETPVPIPNTAVKPTSADGTALATGWESRSLPGISLLFLRAVLPRVHRRGRRPRRIASTSMTTAPTRIDSVETRHTRSWRITCQIAAGVTLCASSLVVAEAAQSWILLSEHQLSLLGALGQVWPWWICPLFIVLGAVVVTRQKVSASLRGTAVFFLWVASLGFAGIGVISVSETLVFGWFDVWLILGAVAGLVTAFSSIPFSIQP